jgi:lysophospholipase L1-like esterase
LPGVGVEVPGGVGGVAGAARPRARWRPRLRRALLVGAAAYLVGLHALLWTAITQDDFGLRVQRKLGLEPVTKEFDRSFRWWASALARSDARARPGALLFLGDSIMRDLDTSSIARHTINLAVPADTTARLLTRAERYSSVLTARGVVIGIGVNDLDWRPVPEALHNYKKLLDLVPLATPILALSVLPIDEEHGDAPTFNAQVRRMNEGIATLCADRPGCRFVDFAARLTDGEGNLAEHAHDGDGKHLSAAGHEIYWNAINAAVLNFIPPAEVTPPAR